MSVAVGLIAVRAAAMVRPGVIIMVAVTVVLAVVLAVVVAAVVVVAVAVPAAVVRRAQQRPPVCQLLQGGRRANLAQPLQQVDALCGLCDLPASAPLASVQALRAHLRRGTVVASSNYARGSRAG